MKVPFIDLKLQYDSIKGEINEGINQVIDESAFAGGKFVSKFEEEFAAFCHCKYAIGVGSGTEALWLALVGLGIKQGDEVITVPNTFIATAEAISFCGAKPVFVDIDAETYTINTKQIEAAITSKTKAIVPVHLYGQMADMDPIMEIARRNNLFVIEDACQAHGALYKGRPAGSIGDAGCFSFYPGKNLGAFGEAGAVVTNNPDLEKTIKLFRDHGQPKKYYHDVIGWNARMDGLQGSVLSVKLRNLDSWNEQRRENARLYDILLSHIPGIVLPKEAAYAKHVYHIYPIRVKERDAFIKALSDKDIHCGIHYPVPIHFTEAYQPLGLGKGSFPVAEQAAGELVSLPMYPGLTEIQIIRVTNVVNETARLFGHEN